MADLEEEDDTMSITSGAASEAMFDTRIPDARGSIHFEGIFSFASNAIKDLKLCSPSLVTPIANTDPFNGLHTSVQGVCLCSLHISESLISYAWLQL